MHQNSNDLATLLLSYYTGINLLKLWVSRSSVQFLGQNTHCQLCQIVKIQPFPDDQDMGLLDLGLLLVNFVVWLRTPTHQWEVYELEWCWLVAKSAFMFQVWPKSTGTLLVHLSDQMNREKIQRKVKMVKKRSKVVKKKVTLSTSQKIASLGWSGTSETKQLLKLKPAYNY